MKHRIFGRLGWQVSEIGFGAWAIGGTAWGKQGDNESIRALHKALDLGCNFMIPRKVTAMAIAKRSLAAS